MGKNCSVKITMLEMYTQFLKRWRKKDVNTYREIVCAKHFISVNYRISPTRRIFLVIQNEKGGRKFIGANV